MKGFIMIEKFLKDIKAANKANVGKILKVGILCNEGLLNVIQFTAASDYSVMLKSNGKFTSYIQKLFENLISEEGANRIHIEVK